MMNFRLWRGVGLMSGLAVVALAISRAAAHQPERAPGAATSASTVIAPPSARDARALGVGGFVPDVLARDLADRPVSWRTGRGDKLTVIALTSVTCPLSKKFAPSLARIETAYAGKGVKFVYINVSGADTADEMRTQVKTAGFKGLYLDDKDHAVALALHAQTTTEVFVVDAGNTLVYRGAASDQYGVGFAHDEPRHRYLEDALDAAVTGTRPQVAATTSPGCALELPAVAQPAALPAVTYTKDIARIMQSNCVECHRSGGVGPFSLDTFEAVSKRATMINTVVSGGIMPPWFAAPVKSDGHESPWANDRSLSAAEKSAISAWIQGGKVRGDEADLPLANIAAPGEWSIGTPSAVYTLPQPIEIKAEGVMPYQMVAVRTNQTEDAWVRAVEVLPTDRSVVHHALVFVLDGSALREGRLRDREEVSATRGFFAAYVPGNGAVVYPAGTAKRLPKGAVLLFQIHYTPNGVATTDQMKIGLVFDKQPPAHIVHTAGIANRGIKIPANAANHEEVASVTMPADAKMLAFVPHMHVRGKAFRYDVERPGAAREVVLDIPRYDFNWQLRYLLREPMDLPLGTTIHATAWYDNSAGNPANPDPNKVVRWGQQTYDEMMLGYIEYYLVEEDPNHPDELPDGATGGSGALAGGGKLMFERLLRRFDTDKNGRIERSESPANLLTQFDRLDKNKDGVLTRDEFGR